MSRLEASQWLHNVGLCLNTAADVATQLVEGQTIILKGKFDLVYSFKEQKWSQEDVSN